MNAETIPMTIGEIAEFHHDRAAATKPTAPKKKAASSLGRPLGSLVQVRDLRSRPSAPNKAALNRPARQGTGTPSMMICRLHFPASSLAQTSFMRPSAVSMTVTGP